ncbi:hypothetical protein Klosneuvirus_2_294 [Klosneuvirus KNV1]|uniref:Uncharacterized protein n=1 Tax=Klosneuvirus KNV1 TaxID=1977640 RepID=A0A1V0SJR2_9VIRU|nr:hypothetical protein Klosneuvirus_2_294 [Klosneuvirus KNV1]
MDEILNNCLSFALGIILCIIFWLILRQKYVIVKKTNDTKP